MTVETTRRTRRPTLGDVAALAAVSLPTVSKVVNGHGDVAVATRERVQRAIAEVGYVQRGARAALGRSIEVVVDHLTTPYAVEVLRGTTLAAEEVGAEIGVSRFHRAAPENGWVEPADWARHVARSGRTGAIVLTAQLLPEHLAGLDQEHIPVVMIDPLDLTNPDVPSVGSTNWTGGRTATEHLIELGHRRIGAIGGRSNSIAATARVHGFHAAFASAGLAVDEELVTFSAFDFDSGLATAGQWLDRDDPPTAIFAASDIQAMGVIEAARRRGLRVPDDLSVVGYDDTHVAAWTSPPLTCVRQPLQEMGRVAVRTLIALADGERLDAPHVELATQLVVRGSTAAPRGGRS